MTSTDFRGRAKRLVYSARSALPWREPFQAAVGSLRQKRLPAALPTSAPWNAPFPTITPTPDHSGSATHPGVLDFGERGWNRWRFWMTMTPYLNSDEELENPCILHSQDGFVWSVPSGLENPIDPSPDGSEVYNSDPALVFDPETDLLWCVWREADRFVEAERLWCASSSDGVRWSTPHLMFATTDGTDAVAPTIARVGDEWWMFSFTASGTGKAPMLRRTGSMTGVWSAPVPLSGLVDWWHGSVIRDEQGIFRMLYVSLARRGKVAAMYATSSADGVAWADPAPVMRSRKRGQWDAAVYQPSFQPDGPEWFRVWYGANSLVPGNWRIGMTRVPRSLWPEPR